MSAKGKAPMIVDGKEDAPWVEKYRPQTLDDVAAHKEIVDTIKRLVKEERFPHVLFYGPPGTGKTSTILAVARQMYGASMRSMVLELNASDDRGISIVREQVVDFASTRTMFSNKFKLVILDECDAMTRDAQFALRRVIEKYTRNTRFCLICNYVGKIIPALQSRCTKFRFPPLAESYVRSRLQHVIECERVNVREGGLDALVALGQGDMRRTLNILQATHMSSEDITEETVYKCTGSPLPKDIERIVNALFNEDFEAVFRELQGMQVNKGLALTDIVQQLHPWVFRIDMPARERIFLVDALADVEHRLAFGTSERLQLGSLIGAFTDAREGIVAAAK
ncbi:g3708 [Coccomyxa viridis]|uniref:G3708 protein n=1 Tax=Coccomyxa viridis TaxID=1274662 RepID=A0ABP1FQS6_9CHLO